MPWGTARWMYTPKQDGMSMPWRGRVWLNPPFGLHWPKWVQRLIDHGTGTALLAARTETAAFYRLVWHSADAVCFVKGRPHFYTPDGMRAPFNSGAPIALAAYGEEDVAALHRAKLGVVLTLNNVHAQGVDAKEGKNV
jgi:hypothetical protein